MGWLFSAGRFRLGIDKHNYKSPDRPWYRRTLHIAYLDEDDARALDALIRRVWGADPPQAAIPDTLKFRFNWPDRREVQLNPQGGLTIFAEGSGRPFLPLGRKVLTVEIWRLESDRRDFRELKLQLPDQQCTLRMWPHQGQGVQQLEQEHRRKSSLAASAAIFTQPRIRDNFSLHGAPRSLDETRRFVSPAIRRGQGKSLSAMILVRSSLLGKSAGHALAVPVAEESYNGRYDGTACLGGSMDCTGTPARDAETRRGKFEAERAAIHANTMTDPQRAARQ